MFKKEFEFSYSDWKAYSSCPYKFLLSSKTKLIRPRPKRITDSRNFLDGWCAHKGLELWNKLGRWSPGWFKRAVIQHRIGSRGGDNYDLIGLDDKKANLVNVIMRSFERKNYVKWRFTNDCVAAHTNITEGFRLIEEGIYAANLAVDKVYSEKWFNVRFPKLNIRARGSTDLIDYRYYDLYDMKFSKNSKNTDWKQLKWYDLVFTILYNKKIRCVKTFSPLLQDKFEERINTKKDLKELVEQLAETISSIRKGEFEAKPSSGNCYFCYVKDSCEHCFSVYTTNESLENSTVDSKGNKKIAL